MSWGAGSSSSSSLEFWPLPEDLAGESLQLQVRGDPVGPVGDRGITGILSLPLAPLAAQIGRAHV